MSDPRQNFIPNADFPPKSVKFIFKQSEQMTIIAVIHFSFLGMRVLAGFDKQTMLRRKCHNTGEIFCSSYSEKFLTRQVAPSSGQQWESSTKQTRLDPQGVPDSHLAICGVPGLCSTCWN